MRNIVLMPGEVAAMQLIGCSEHSSELVQIEKQIEDPKLRSVPSTRGKSALADLKLSSKRQNVKMSTMSFNRIITYFNHYK